MPVQGLRTTADFVAGQRPESWREGILMLYPRSAEAAKAPLTALTSRMKERAISDFTFNWWEKSLQSRRLTLTASLTAPAAGTVQTISMSGGGALGFKEGDLFIVEDGLGDGGALEILRVAADPTSNTSLSVVRGFAGTTPAAVTFNGNNVNPNILCIGSAYEQGSLPPTGVSFDPTLITNYTQIFRSTLELTRTAMKTKTRTGDTHKEMKREALENLGVDMERAFLFGKKSTGSHNGRPITTTDGVYSKLASGNKLATTGAALKMTQLEAWMLEFFRFGSSEKLALGGNKALLAIQQAVRKNSNYQIFANEKLYGMKITKIISPFGELNFLAHPLMNQITGGTTGTGPYYGQEAAMFVLDMSNFTYVYLDGSDVSFEDELEVPGMDGLKEGWIGECGLEISHASTHFYAYNMNAGAADS